MKSNLKFLVIIIFLGSFLQSCSNDDDDGTVPNAPIISDFEYGKGSSHSTDQVAYKGSDIHLEAKINAEAIVSSVFIDIHAHDLSPGDGEVEWNFKQTFTNDTYLVINPTFHEHIDVPTNIPAGKYHIVLTVTDKSGNSTKIERHIQILDSITISDISIDTTVARGDDFHTEFMIHAVNSIYNIKVDVHTHGITPGSGEVEWNYKAVFQDGYHEQTKIEFHEHIDVPVTAAAGKYHIIFTVEDKKGNTKKYETHIDITTV